MRLPTGVSAQMTADKFVPNINNAVLKEMFAVSDFEANRPLRMRIPYSTNKAYTKTYTRKDKAIGIWSERPKRRRMQKQRMMSRDLR